MNYKKKYFKHFGYGDQDHIPCELCQRIAVDIHHIKYRSRGGDDSIENLMALCRKHHDMAHNEELKEDYLRKVHDSFLNLVDFR